MSAELELRKEFFDNAVTIETIYFGGGTPSVLTALELEQLLQTIRSHYSLADDVEICLEANPDDLDFVYLKSLKSAGVNRLSVGVQSLNDDILQWMNRSHNSTQARQCIADAATLGFEDITVDLIYGVPTLSLAEWKSQVDEVLSWPINHLSAYSLTLEDRTAYNRFVQREQYLPPDDELAAQHYNSLQNAIQSGSWEQYEISNYAKSGNYSRHNTAYWKGLPYLGVGPAAHSYSHNVRSWNIRSNNGYIQALSKGELSLENEDLSLIDQANEYLITRLRTKWGIDLDVLKKKYNVQPDMALINQFKDKGWLNIDGSSIWPTAQGMLFSDHICRDLLIDHSSQISS